MGFKNLREHFKSPGDRYIAEKRAVLQPFLVLDPLKASVEELRKAVIEINKHLPDIVAKKKTFGDENNKRAGRSGIGMSFSAAALLCADVAVTGGAVTLLSGSVVGVTGQFLYIERNHRFRKFYLEVQEKHDTFKNRMLQKQTDQLVVQALHEQWKRQGIIPQNKKEDDAPLPQDNQPHNNVNENDNKPKRPRPVKKPLPPPKKGM